jgi:hypothetical protein
MDSVKDITAIVRHEVADYVRPSPNSTAYYLDDDEKQIYVVIAVPNRSQEKPTIIVMARIVDERIIIDTDITNKPLYNALQNAGIPSDRIIRAYEGEKPPVA